PARLQDLDVAREAAVGGPAARGAGGVDAGALPVGDHPPRGPARSGELPLGRARDLAALRLASATPDGCISHAQLARVLAELETLSQEVGVSCDRCHRTVTFSVDGAATALRRMQS